MAVKQLSVFIENKKGQMAEAVKKIADSKINIRAMSVADSRDFGILRLIVTDTEKAKELLSEDTLVKVSDVVAVKMEDVEGSLYGILKVLEDAAVNVEYSYSFTAGKTPAPYVVFRVDDVVAAEKLLADKGFSLITEADI